MSSSPEPKQLNGSSQAKSDVNSDLRYACRHGNIDKVKILLITEGVNVDGKDGEEFTALHRAAQKGYTDICRLLLDNGANINETNSGGNTALILASSGNHEETVKFLLERDADHSIRAKFKNYTALDFAKSHKRLSIVKILEEAESEGTDETEEDPQAGRIITVGVIDYYVVKKQELERDETYHIHGGNGIMFTESQDYYEIGRQYSKPMSTKQYKSTDLPTSCFKTIMRNLTIVSIPVLMWFCLGKYAHVNVLPSYEEKGVAIFDQSLAISNSNAKDAQPIPDDYVPAVALLKSTKNEEPLYFYKGMLIL